MIDRPLARVLVAEAIGTFALVFAGAGAGAGAIIVDAKTGALGHVGVSLVFGLVIMVMIYAVGHVSGAHFNPAVTFAFALSRHFRGLVRPATGRAGDRRDSRRRAATCLGRDGRASRRDASRRLPATVRPLGGRIDVLPDVRDHGRRHRHPSGRRGRRARDRGNSRARRALRRTDLGSLDEPARSLGPAVVSGNLHALWLYLVALPLGAALGALAYGFVRGDAA